MTFGCCKRLKQQKSIFHDIPAIFKPIVIQAVKSWIRHFHWELSKTNVCRRYDIWKWLRLERLRRNRQECSNRKKTAVLVEKHHSSSSSFQPVIQTTAWPHLISGQMLSSLSIVSLSRTVRSCSPWEGQWIGHCRTTWSPDCTSARHSQAAKEATPHLWKQQRKTPSPMGMRLSRSQALIWRVIRVCVCRCRGSKCGVCAGSPSAPHFIGDPPSAAQVCCCCHMNWGDVVWGVQMGVPIWGSVSLHWMAGCAQSEADVQAPRHDVPATVWLHCDEAQQVGFLRGLGGKASFHSWVSENKTSKGWIFSLLDGQHQVYAQITRKQQICSVETTSWSNRAYIGILEFLNLSTDLRRSARCFQYFVSKARIFM